jgi:hypothetical protein
MVFCFIQNLLFGQHENYNEAQIFFPEFNISFYDKNSESDYFFFLHQNQNIFLEKNLQVKWSFS